MQGRRLQLHSARGLGFSFVELLFAIAVLGIGFIMLAAIFPVGLQQTKLTIDETNAAGNSRGMIARLTQIAAGQMQYTGSGTPLPCIFPRTYQHRVVGLPVENQRYNGQVRTLNDQRVFADGTGAPGAPVRRFEMWRRTANELIQPADARLATTFLFKRDAVGGLSSTGTLEFQAASTAQLISINAQVANQSTFGLADIFKLGSTATAQQSKMAIYNLEPRPVAVQIYRDNGEGAYLATFASVTTLNGGGFYTRGGYPTGNDPNNQPWDDVLDAAVGSLVEGAFIIISDDRVTAPVNSIGRMNGRIFKLGNRRTDLGNTTFELAPGYDFEVDPGADGVFYTAGLNPFTGLAYPADDIVGIGVDQTDSTATNSQAITANASGNAVTVAGSGAGHGAVALVLGRGFQPTLNGVTPTVATDYVGPAMDIAVYTTFVPTPNP